LNIGYVSSYCAGAAGAGFVAGAGSAGFEASGEAGFIVSLAGGLVLWVVVLSVPLSLQAATPKRAIAEIDARMSFFMTSLLQINAHVLVSGQIRNAPAKPEFRNVAFPYVTPTYDCRA
jgi:hypothetical protein